MALPDASVPPQSPPYWKQVFGKKGAQLKQRPSTRVGKTCFVLGEEK